MIHLPPADEVMMLSLQLLLVSPLQPRIELSMKVCEDFTIMEKAPTRAFSWLKAPASVFTFMTLSRYYLFEMGT